MRQDVENVVEKPVIVEIDEERAGQRIDNFLITRLKKLPKSRIYRLLRKGEVRVNKGRIKPDYRLKSGDKVRIPPVRLPSSIVEQPSDDSISRVNHAIIYQDDQVLVINKPSGMAVHGGSGVSYGVIEALRALFPHEKHLELVHRLDRETSGCLVVARKRSVLKSLHEQLRNNDIQKTYLALVKGEWKGGKTTVEAPLKKNVQRSGERMVQVDPTGKPAQSVFKPVRVLTGATLVEVELITGRTHQIRVHAAHVGHPIAGDEKYGQRGFNLTMKQRGLNRLFLHAKSLTFTLPDKDTAMTVVAPLGEELEAVLRRLGDDDNYSEDPR